MRRWASAAPFGRRAASRSEEFSGLHEIALADRSSGPQALPSERMRVLRLQTGWARAVGAPLSEVARLRACGGGRLLVDVPDIAWKREMDRLKPRILEALAREVPCAPVTELAFMVSAGGDPDGGASARCGRAGPLPVPAAAPVETLPEALYGALARVEDAVLRGRLGQVMGRYLSHRKPSC